MKTIDQLLKEKGTQMWSIGPEDTVYAALQRMAEHNIGALIVLESGKLSGLVTERDYTRKVILQGKSSKQTSVREIMIHKPVCGHVEQKVEECMALMTDKRVRHLPILQNDELVGIVSIGDLVKSIIAEQKFIIDQLEHYISG